MFLIALFNHVFNCFQNYQTRRQIARLTPELRKDIEFDAVALDRESKKANIVQLLKDLFAYSLFVSRNDRARRRT